MNYYVDPATRAIPLTQGLFALVSPEDFRRVMKRKWCLLKKLNGDIYAQTNMKIGGKWVRVLLHRFLMEAPAGIQVDHQDGNGLNCKRNNVRFATHGQNMHNQRPRGGSSCFKGVSWNKNSGKWIAQIMTNRKSRYLGLHVSEEDAARAYDAAAKEMHGAFARLNFPQEAA